MRDRFPYVLIHLVTADTYELQSLPTGHQENIEIFSENRKRQCIKILKGTKASFGRSHHNQVVIRDAKDRRAISRHHGSIQFDEDGIKIHDLKSSNGIIVNGRRTSASTALVDHDIVCLACGIDVTSDMIIEYLPTRGDTKEQCSRKLASLKSDTVLIFQVHLISNTSDEWTKQTHMERLMTISENEEMSVQEAVPPTVSRPNSNDPGASEPIGTHTLGLSDVTEENPPPIRLPSSQSHTIHKIDVQSALDKSSCPLPSLETIMANATSNEDDTTKVFVSSVLLKRSLPRQNRFTLDE